MRRTTWKKKLIAYGMSALMVLGLLSGMPGSVAKASFENEDINRWGNEEDPAPLEELPTCDYFASSKMTKDSVLVTFRCDPCEGYEGYYIVTETVGEEITQKDPIKLDLKKTSEEAEYLEAATTFEGIPDQEVDYEVDYYLQALEGDEKIYPSKAEKVNFRIDRKKPVLEMKLNQELNSAKEFPLVESDLSYNVTASENCNATMHAYKQLAIGQIADLSCSETLSGDNRYEMKKIFSVNDDGSADGLYTVYTTASDIVGNMSKDPLAEADEKNSVVNFKIDCSVPVTEMSVPEGKEVDGTIFCNEKQEIFFKVTDLSPNPEAGYKVFISENEREFEEKAVTWKKSEDNAFSYEASVAFEKDGRYKVRLEATDAEGLQAKTKDISFVVDEENPEIQIDKVKVNYQKNAANREPEVIEESFHQKEQTIYYLRDTANLSFDVKETNYETAKVYVKAKHYLDGGMVQDDRTFKMKQKEDRISTTFEGEGLYISEISGKDAAGNKSDPEIYRHIIIDETAPQLAIEGMKNQQMTTKAVDLTFSAIDRNHDYSEYLISVTRSDVDGEIDSTVISGQEKSAFDIENGGWTTSKEAWEQQKEYKTQRTLHFSEEGIYEVHFWGMDKASNEAKECVLTFYIDYSAPVLQSIQYSNVNGMIPEKYHTIFSNQAIKVEFSLVDKIVGVDERKVYVTVGTPVDRDSQTPIYIAHKSAGNRYYVYIPTDLKVNEFSDPITVWANDLLQNESQNVSINMIYNTLIPAITMDCDTDYTAWTNQDVTFHTTVSDEKSGISEVVYKINGKTVKTEVFRELVHDYAYDVTATETASKVTGYTVSVEVTNNCGTKNTMRRQVYIDKEKPIVTLSGVENGTHYNTSQTVETQVQEVSYENTKTVYVVKRVLDGKTTEMSAAAFHSRTYNDSCKRKMIPEGKYKIYAVTTDSAGNTATSNTLEFVVDKTAPVVAVTGVGNGSVHAGSVSLDFSCVESFYETNQVTIQVERTLDGKTTTETLRDMPKNAKKSSMQHTFSEDGTYVVTITATDQAGNKGNTQTITFTVDGTKPEISIAGTSNYELWKEPVSLRLSVTESYYSGNEVSIVGTKTDVDGNVSEINIPSFVNSGKISSLTQLFSEDGIYYLEIVSKDEAGNMDRKHITFTIDQTAPEIRGVKEYDGKYLQEFQLANSLSDVFKDLTVISYRILLNGVEYNGTDTITEEGKYTLDMEVKDELSHMSNDQVEFIIDHTAPKIIFSGVKNGENVHEKGEITIGLVNAEDEITSVRMNGKECGADTRKLEYEKYGSYRIEVDCKDKAGNSITRSMDFVFSNTRVILFILLGLVIALMLSLVIWGIQKNQREKGAE